MRFHNSGETEKKYCHKCGRLLVDREIANGYDEYTGEKKILKYRDCPKHREHMEELYGW